METDAQTPPKNPVHLGKNTQRIREIIGMKQSTLASNTGYSQQYISKLEQSDHFADDILEKISKGLGVAPDLIKNFNEEKAIYNIQNNYDSSANNHQNYKPSYTNEPIDKVVDLFEKLLQGEKEKVELLANVNKAIHDLGEQLSVLKQRMGNE